MNLLNEKSPSLESDTQNLVLLQSVKSPITAPKYHDDDIICHCLSIKRGEIAPILKTAKRINLDKLIGNSGAGSVCTGCHHLLREMAGDDVWIAVKITAIESLGGNTKSYRFESLGEAFQPARAGQHIIVQAFIDGRWELRRYTLTTPAEETGYREITVRRQAYGKFSNWLSQIDQSEKNIRISQPLGDVTPSLSSKRPLVCLVGGIGVTPAMAFIRTLYTQTSNTRKLILDYSELNENRLVYKNELQSMAKQNGNIHLHFRLTEREGFVRQCDIDQLLKKHPDSEFYICGPLTFSNTVVSYLHHAGVNKDAISIENFIVAQTEKIKSSTGYFYLGISLWIAFFMQELLQLKMPWLESLQLQENYKIYSGLVLVAYILSQFIMPYNKSCKSPHASAKTYCQHKIRGALAPLVFYIHSSTIGVGYLVLLASVYFVNLLLGLFNHERIKDTLHRVQYFKFWLQAHIILSVLLVALIVFHIYIVASY